MKKGAGYEIKYKRFGPHVMDQEKYDAFLCIPSQEVSITVSSNNCITHESRQYLQTSAGT